MTSDLVQLVAHCCAICNLVCCSLILLHTWSLVKLCFILLHHSCTKNEMTWDLVQLVAHCCADPNLVCCSLILLHTWSLVKLCFVSAASQLHQKRDDMGFGAAGRSLLRCPQFILLQSDLAAHLICCQTSIYSAASQLHQKRDDMGFGAAHCLVAHCYAIPNLVCCSLILLHTWSLVNFCVVLLLHSCTKNEMTWDLVQLVAHGCAVCNLVCCSLILLHTWLLVKLCFILLHHSCTLDLLSTFALFCCFTAAPKTRWHGIWCSSLSGRLPVLLRCCSLILLHTWSLVKLCVCLVAHCQAFCSSLSPFLLLCCRCDIFVKLCVNLHPYCCNKNEGNIAASAADLACIDCTKTEIFDCPKACAGFHLQRQAFCQSAIWSITTMTTVIFVGTTIGNHVQASVFVALFLSCKSSCFASQMTWFLLMMPCEITWLYLTIKQVLGHANYALLQSHKPK